MILLEELVSLIVISASCLMVNSVGFPMFIGPICTGKIAATATGRGLQIGKNTIAPLDKPLVSVLCSS